MIPGFFWFGLFSTISVVIHNPPPKPERFTEFNVGVIDLATNDHQQLTEIRLLIGTALSPRHEVGLVAWVTPVAPERSGYVLDLLSNGAFYRFNWPTHRDHFVRFFAGGSANLIVTDRHPVYKDYRAEYGLEVGVRLTPWRWGDSTIGITIAPRWQVITPKDGPAFSAKGISWSLVLLRY